MRYAPLLRYFVNVEFVDACLFSFVDFLASVNKWREFIEHLLLLKWDFANSLQISIDMFFLQDSSGIFWDNDSLAALLALELKADLLILLSDVEGLYSGPPSDPKSRLIRTYIKERHQGEITFGDKSRVGRGGMTAKVNAAVNAAKAGIPVVITRYCQPGFVCMLVLVLWDKISIYSVGRYW